MARIGVLTIGLALLWAVVCAGDVAYIEPQAGDGSGQGAAEGYDGTTEPKPDPGYEVVGSEPGSDYVVTDTKPDPGSEVTSEEPAGDGDVVYAKPDGGDVADATATGENDNKIYTMSPTASSEGVGSTLDISHLLATLSPQNGCASILSHIPADFLTNLGMVPGTGNEGMNPQIPVTVPTGHLPDVAQVRSTIGLGLGEQAAAVASAASNIPSLSGQFGSMATQFSGQATQVFSGIQMPGIANMLPGQ